MNEIRIACCGLWHSHAKDFPLDRVPKMCQGLPYQFVAVWDPDPIKGKAFARELTENASQAEAPKLSCHYEPSFEAICQDPDIDAVMITAPTTAHAAMVIQAANAGKHIFIEKALSTNPKEARAALEAVKKGGVHFTISDPIERPELIKAKEIMDQGLLGKITSIRYRCVHAFGLTDSAMMTPFYQKEAAGEGSIFDLGHHSVHVLLWFMGEPDQAVSIVSPFTNRGIANQIDEVSAAMYHFPSGAIGIAEAGWLNPGNENSFELNGTKGFLRWDCDGLRYAVNPSNERGATVEWTRVPSSECPRPSTPPAVRYWMESILNDTPNEQYTIEDAVKVCEMIAQALERKEP